MMKNFPESILSIAWQQLKTRTTGMLEEIHLIPVHCPGFPVGSRCMYLGQTLISASIISDILLQGGVKVKNLRFLILLIMVVLLSAWAPAPQGLNIVNPAVQPALVVPVLISPTTGSHAMTSSWTPTFTWKNVLGNTYLVKISTSTDFTSPIYTSPEITGTGTTLNHKLATPLPLGPKLYWHVSATDGSSSVKSAVWYFFNDLMPAPVLSLPANGSLLPATNNWKPTLTWTYPAKDATYQLEISTSPDFSIPGNIFYNRSVPAGSGTISHPVDTMLPVNTILYWRVKANVPGAGDSPYSLTRRFTTAVVPKPTLSKPANNSLLPTTVPVTPTVWKPRLIWTYPATILDAKFTLEIAKDPAFSEVIYPTSPLDISNTPTGGVITHDVTDELPANKKLYWRVTASVGTDNSAPSTAFTFITRPKDVASGFSPINGDVQKAQRPEFRWNSSENASSYAFQVATDAAIKVLKYNGTVTSSSAEIVFTLPVDLPLNQPYVWRVAAKGTPFSTAVSGWSPYQSFRTPTTVPPVPVLLKPLTGSALTTYDAVFDWNSVAGNGITYNLQVSKSSTFVMTSDDLDLSNIADSTYSATLGTGIYYWRVRSKDTDGYLSNWSKVFSFKTPAALTLHVLDSLTKEGLASANVTISGMTTAGVPTIFPTDENGDLTVPNIPAGTRTIKVIAGDDYLPTTLAVPFAVGVTAKRDMSIKHIPIIVKLTWGKNIYNLDSHLWVPGTDLGHIYPEIGMMGSTTAFPWAKLSGDAFGYTTLKTETLTIANRFPGTYYFAVVATDGDQIPSSDAKVTLYYNGVKWKEYIPPAFTGTSSYYWYVFSLDGATGLLTEQNKMVPYAEVQTTFPYDPYGGYAVPPK
jgi:hypothetical protein